MKGVERESEWADDKRLRWADWSSSVVAANVGMPQSIVVKQS